MVAIAIITMMTGTPTPVITSQPAMERANTTDGNNRKQRRRYRTANQRYLLGGVFLSIKNLFYIK